MRSETRREDGRTDGRSVGRSDGRWLRFVSGLKRVVGMPDYPGYLHHMEERHPGCPVLSERQFYDEQVMARYGNGVSRCC